MFHGASRGLSAILPSIYSLLVHTVHGQEQLTRFVARLAFMEKVCFDLVDSSTLCKRNTNERSRKSRVGTGFANKSC